MSADASGPLRKLKYCGVCEAPLHDGEARVVRMSKIDGTPLIFEVPARVCTKCGHKWFSIQTIRMIEAAQRGELKPTGSMTVPVFSSSAQ